MTLSNSITTRKDGIETRTIVTVDYDPHGEVAELKDVYVQTQRYSENYSNVIHYEGRARHMDMTEHYEQCFPLLCDELVNRFDWAIEYRIMIDHLKEERAAG